MTNNNTLIAVITILAGVYGVRGCDLKFECIGCGGNFAPYAQVNEKPKPSDPTKIVNKNICEDFSFHLPPTYKYPASVPVEIKRDKAHYITVLEDELEKEKQYINDSRKMLENELERYKKLCIIKKDVSQE